MQEESLQMQIEERVICRLDLTKETPGEELYHRIDEEIAELAKLQYISLKQRLRLRQAVYYSMCGLDVLTPLLEKEEITEIMINGYDHIFVEEAGIIRKLPLKFRSPEKYRDVIQQIVADANRRVNESSPIVDARLQDGSRVNVVLSPVALDGSVMTIRKFPKEAMTMEKLVALGSLSEEIAELLELLVKSGYNIMISGGTGSGKTTFLNALSNYIPKGERIITIEDSAELQLRNVENLVRLEVRNANVEGKNEIRMKDLIKSSLRMRPDRIIIGEVRSEEALDMLQALNTGHDGSISTGHANSAKDMLSRLETMVLMGIDMPMQAIRGQIASALEVIIHLGRLRDHSRRVIEIMEVLGMDNGEITCSTLFSFVQEEYQKEVKMDEVQKEAAVHMRVKGQLVPFHELRQLQKLKEAGYYEKYCNLMQQLKVEM